MFKRIISVLFVFLLAFPACATQESGGKTEYAVEFGDTFTLPKFDGQDSVVLKDEDGKEIKTQFGSFKPEVGTYTAKYKIGFGKWICPPIFLISLCSALRQSG